MVWYSLNLGTKHKVKYTPLKADVKEYPLCDEDGNSLTRVSGKVEKGHFVDEKGNKHDKAFRLINGKASSGFSGRIKDIENPIYVEKAEAEDVLVEKEYLVESDKLYDELMNKNQAIKFGGYFANGFRAYKCYITPSDLYKGFSIMKVGRGLKSEVIKEIVGDLTESNRLKEKLASVELTLQKVNEAKIDDLIAV